MYITYNIHTQRTFWRKQRGPVACTIKAHTTEAYNFPTDCQQAHDISYTNSNIYGILEHPSTQMPPSGLTIDKLGDVT